MRKNFRLFLIVGVLPLLLTSAFLAQNNEPKKEQKTSIRGIMYIHGDTAAGKDQVKRQATAPAGTAVKETKVKAKLPPRPADAPPPVGLGYTLFREQADGLFVRANPRQKFHTGDHIRFMFEPFIDGYLYIIHREGNGTPKLLFPDSRLVAGNRVRAYTAVAIPAETEKYNYFEFRESEKLKAQGQIMENVTVILSRDDLGADVDAILTGIGALGKDRLYVLADARNDAGLAITRQEKEAIRVRDLSLGTAPQASVVVANWGLDPVVVAKIDLTHAGSR